MFLHPEFIVFNMYLVCILEVSSVAAERKHDCVINSLANFPTTALALGSAYKLSDWTFSRQNSFLKLSK